MPPDLALPVALERAGIELRVRFRGAQLRRIEEAQHGRDPQSIAFFSTPGIDRLYSGETKRMPPVGTGGSIFSNDA